MISTRYHLRMIFLLGLFWSIAMPSSFSTIDKPIEAVAAQGLVPEVVAVRSGLHKNYSRVVLDWSKPVDYRVVRKPEELILMFDRPAEMDLSAVVARTGDRLTEARAEDNGMRLVLGIKGRVAHIVREFDGSVLAIDVLDKPLTGNAKTAAAEAALTPSSLSKTASTFESTSSQNAKPDTTAHAEPKGDAVVARANEGWKKTNGVKPNRTWLMTEINTFQRQDKAIGDRSKVVTSLANEEPDQRCVVGWVPYWDQKPALQSFMNNIDLFGHLSLFWYYLNEDGRIAAFQNTNEDRRIIEFAQENGVKVFGLIANLPDDPVNPWLSLINGLLDQIVEREETGDSWDRERVAKMLETYASRRRHIVDIVNLADSMNFDGINIDYEALQRQDREGFSLFIEELAEALHARDKMLAVALHAKTAEFNPMEDNGSHAQDWDRISAAADQLHFITYGQHWAGTPPGPIASPAWIQRVLDYALNERTLPTDKIVFGLPLYAEDWFKTEEDCYLASCYEGSGNEVTYTDIRQFLREQDTEVQWDAEHQTPYMIYETSDGNQHITWFEDSRSLEAKLELRDRYDICNVGLWRLGGEDPKIWDVVRNAMQTHSRQRATAGVIK